MPTIEIAIRRLLNRVSDSNKCIIVRNLTDLLKDIGDDDSQSDAITKFIEHLFHKCMNERNFIELYVDIIYETLVSIRPNHPELASKIYRSLVLRSQREFEEDISLDNRIDKLSCTRFVAQLTNKKFVNTKLLHGILKNLLESDNQFKYELACVLITDVDAPIIKAANKDNIIDFLVVKGQRKEEGKVCKRILFMLEDVLLKLHRI